ncbi:hypothetical protein BB560_000519 [Smittium megazygosporum]|uniref:Uncharacterized protein n=1 Tax=Smittium megazygosporum TaxID=133381 RepID=A0A2T9ZK65_9FUNG|nr:hypothetical protein BB560_000519 [Smittium megazygosporum]
MSGQAFFIGGIGQLIGGITCYYENDVFHAAALSSFGLDWTGKGLISYIYDIFIIYTAGSETLTRASHAEFGIVSLTWSFWVIVLFLSKIRAELSTLLMLLLLNHNILLETIGGWINNEAL